MKEKVTEKVAQMAQPIVEELGYELYEVEYVKKKDQPGELLIYIDNEKGISLEDCEKVSRALDVPLDELDPIEDAYVLCVSSPGLDRPLKKEQDWQRAMGKMVEVRLFSKKNGKKEYVGELLEYSKENVIINQKKEGQILFLRSEIALIRLYIEF